MLRSKKFIGLIVILEWSNRLQFEVFDCKSDIETLNKYITQLKQNKNDVSFPSWDNEAKEKEKIHSMNDKDLGEMLDALDVF